MLQIDGKKLRTGINMIVAGHPGPSQPNALLSLDIPFGSRQDALHERSCSTPSLGQEEAVMSRNPNRETEFIPAVQARMPRARVSWSTISGPLTLVAIATDLPLNRAEIQMVDGLGDHPIDQCSEECAAHLNGLLFGDHAEGTMQLCQLVKAKTQNGKLLDIIVLLDPSQKFSVLMSGTAFPLGTTFPTACKAVYAAVRALRSVCALEDPIVQLQSEPKEEFISNVDMQQILAQPGSPDQQ